MEHPKDILKEYWGFNNFRSIQENIINDVLNQQDVIALLPTGGGKSICFQVPTLIKSGLCLVISPLIALMQDQVQGLAKKGIKATYIPSGTTQDDLITLFDNIKFGKFKFLYISPERLQASFIQQKIKELNINLVAIDEAHCISEWGHDFRPSYRRIQLLKELKPDVNFIALTATANKKVLTDIATNLGLQTPKIQQLSFFRENLAYQVFNFEDKLQQLINIFTKTKKPAIVYVNSRKKTEQISNFLNTNNFKATFYHAGLSSVEKKLAFDNWMQEKTPIIVATNAFGMGIDKANVGLVIHLDLPTSIENYVQETGRAGRNLEKSFAVLLYNKNDIVLFKDRLLQTLVSIKEIKEIYKKLYQIFFIALGELHVTAFSFNILEFCKKYNFSVLKVDATLKILSNHDIIEINSQFNKKSTLQFIVTSKKLLSYLSKNTHLKQFTNTILRTYAGLFEQETNINEFFIAKKAGITTKQVLINLERLQKENLITYTPVISDAEICFLHPREDDITINRHSKEIKLFLTQKKKKAIELIDFVKNKKVCRSILLLTYFDEKTEKRCGICDVCLSQKKAKTTNISKEIITVLTNKQALSSAEICNYINANKQDILIHLRQLIALDTITINYQNKYQLKL